MKKIIALVLVIVSSFLVTPARATTYSVDLYSTGDTVVAPTYPHYFDEFSAKFDVAETAYFSELGLFDDYIYFEIYEPKTVTVSAYSMITDVDGVDNVGDWIFHELALLNTTSGSAVAVGFAGDINGTTAETVSFTAFLQPGIYEAIFKGAPTGWNFYPAEGRYKEDLKGSYMAKVAVSAVPEIPTWLMMIFGFVGLIRHIRKHQI